ncbi:ArgS-related anticodon-binding protein NrtL [Streptomyces yaanensis]|uniref:arginine--tRNA ligase n=1 Tax=Streptomyces yaanensis TaxID=1142239 RepID=A0ABV7SGT4_9ACTN|nr:DALR anticodon-binding domain-containing protein [Streptomyces sp. CGMCC 4.7035]WNB97797.1 DALR anticodon-binding domain-containing protein [Streptomyces sp. CGMCC 4.7035]
MTPVELSRTVLRAVRRAVDDGELSVPVPARAVVTPPGPGGCGDYATNIALQLARPAGKPPLDVAEILRPRLRDTAGVADVEITGPGFLNIHLERATATAALVREILERRDGSDPHRLGSTSGSSSPAAYGHTPTLTGHVIPLRIPYDIRAEVVADTLVRVIATQGGRAEVDHARPGEPVDLRPVPAPEDPAPLGPDAARWALLYPAAHDRPRITADHLLQRESNPLFRVRYAHARARALTRNAARLGFEAVPGDVSDTARLAFDDTARLAFDGTPRPAFDGAPGHVPDATPLVPGAASHVSDATPLLRALAGYPTALTQAAAHRAPDRLARHLVGVADALLAFQHTVLPLGDEKPSAAHRARLALAEAAGTVLAGGLSLLGISAPDYL